MATPFSLNRKVSFKHFAHITPVYLLYKLIAHLYILFFFYPYVIYLLAVCAVHRPGVMEVMHNLDYCDVLVIGEELEPERESLELQHSVLLGKHLDATNSTSGISIYGSLS